MARGKKTILIVADNPTQRFYSSLVFDHEKVEIISLIHALDFISNHGIDVILLDSGVNPEVGVELLFEIKKHTLGVPIIFLTDVRSYDAAVSAFKAGVRDYIKKPVSILELKRIITGLLRLKRKSTERREPLPYVGNNGACCRAEASHKDVPEYIIRTVSYIEENLSMINDLDDLADQANLSVFHFSRNFKKYTGLSPMEFVRVMKMHRAKELLRTDGKPIVMVAEEVGYVDLRSFERQFKLYTGSTPARFRRTFPR